MTFTSRPFAPKVGEVLHRQGSAYGNRHEYVFHVEEKKGSTTVLLKPLSKYWLIQIFQVFILRLKY
jgi:hypothetical protein